MPINKAPASTFTVETGKVKEKINKTSLGLKYDLRILTSCRAYLQAVINNELLQVCG